MYIQYSLYVEISDLSILKKEREQEAGHHGVLALGLETMATTAGWDYCIEGAEDEIRVD